MSKCRSVIKTFCRGRMKKTPLLPGSKFCPHTSQLRLFRDNGTMAINNHDGITMFEVHPNKIKVSVNCLSQPKLEFESPNIERCSIIHLEALQISGVTTNNKGWWRA